MDIQKVAFVTGGGTGIGKGIALTRDYLMESGRSIELPRRLLLRLCRMLKKFWPH